LVVVKEAVIVDEIIQRSSDSLLDSGVDGEEPNVVSIDVADLYFVKFHDVSPTVVVRGLNHQPRSTGVLRDPNSR
jgi:hypothetical protein